MKELLKEKLLLYKKLKDHSFIPSLITDSGDMAISHLDKVNTSNSEFYNVFNTDNGQDLYLNECCDMNQINNIEVTTNNITTAVANMSQQNF